MPYQSKEKLLRDFKGLCVWKILFYLFQGFQVSQPSGEPFTNK